MFPWIRRITSLGGYDPDADLQYQVTASISVPNKKLKPNVDVTKPSDGTLEELLSNSENFPKTHPLENVRCRHLLEKEADITKEILEDNANSAYPLLHESALHLYIDFLEHKKQYGSKIEKELYWNMTVPELVQRMVEKRALVFVGNWDFYELVSGATGHGKWEGIGTDEETHPLVLKDCLSYDEIKLSALLTVTSQSVFTNDGRRYNSGCVDPLEKIQRHGVVVGMVGPRLSHGPVMEYQEIIISEHQNTNENGYGHSATGKDKEKWRQLWADFYGVPTLELYEEVVQSLRVNEILARRFKNIGRGLYFDNEIFAKRISIAGETLLLEAESRAAAKNKRAYVYVVGLGLGAWLISPHEYQIYLDAFALCMKNLIHVLTHISDVDFSWFRAKSCGGVKDGGIIGGDNGIRIHFSKRSPHTKLSDPDKLLVVSYAWDGNSFPGNDFWVGSFDSGGDPANACSTQVSELHNAYINKNKVSGDNLHIASRVHGAVHVSEYYKHKNAS